MSRREALERVASRSPDRPGARELRWIRHRPDKAQDLTALAAGVGAGLLVGGVVFYVGRLLLAREPLEPAPSRRGREP